MKQRNRKKQVHTMYNLQAAIDHFLGDLLGKVGLDVMHPERLAATHKLKGKTDEFYRSRNRKR